MLAMPCQICASADWSRRSVHELRASRAMPRVPVPTRGLHGAGNTPGVCCEGHGKGHGDHEGRRIHLAGDPGRHAGRPGSVTPSSSSPYQSKHSRGGWELHWITELGGFLTIHDSHGYSRWEKLVTTDTVVRGRTVVGLYFSTDWCQPCKLFTPLLKKLHASTRAHCTDANRNIPPFEIVLVSRCKEARDTERYFADMPWAAMEHDSATGRQGLALMNKYGVSTIPALVLLDGAGALICNCGQEHLRKDPTGNGFPWPAPISGPRLAQVGFAIPPLAGVRPKKPPGKPPPFPQHRRSTAGLSAGRPVGLPGGRPVGH